MPFKFNRRWIHRLCRLAGWLFCLPVLAIAAQPALGELPLVLPEAVFASMGRVTGDTTDQRIMDRGSIIRVQLADPQTTLPPDTDVLLFRQGLRLRDGKGKRTLGVLAVPVGQGRTLHRFSEAQEIAEPERPGVAWVRLQGGRQEVARGDSLMTVSDAERWANGACQPPPAAASSAADSKPSTTDVQSQVVALAASNGQAGLLSASLDLVAVSGGCANGLAVGQPVSIWRPTVMSYGRKLDQPVEARDNDSSSVFDDNPGIARTQTPEHRIGSGVVVAVYPEAALVRIRVVTQPIEIGDRIRPISGRKSS